MEGGSGGDGGAREEKTAESSLHTAKALTPLLPGQPTAALLSLAGPGESMADGRRMGESLCPDSPTLSLPEAPAEEGRWGSVGAKGEHPGVIRGTQRPWKETCIGLV